MALATFMAFDLAKLGPFIPSSAVDCRVAKVGLFRRFVHSIRPGYGTDDRHNQRSLRIYSCRSPQAMSIAKQRRPFARLAAAVPQWVQRAGEVPSCRLPLRGGCSVAPSGLLRGARHEVSYGGLLSLDAYALLPLSRRTYAQLGDVLFHRFFQVKGGLPVRSSLMACERRGKSEPAPSCSLGLLTTYWASPHACAFAHIRLAAGLNLS